MKRGQIYLPQKEVLSKIPALLGLIVLFLEDNDPIQARSATQMLSLNISKTFLLLNFLITGICISPVSSSFTLAPHPVFMSKTLQTILADAL